MCVRGCRGVLYQQGLCCPRILPSSRWFLPDPRIVHLTGPSKAWGLWLSLVAGEANLPQFCLPPHPLAEISWAFPVGPRANPPRRRPPEWVVGCIVVAQTNSDGFGLLVGSRRINPVLFAPLKKRSPGEDNQVRLEQGPLTGERAKMSPVEFLLPNRWCSMVGSRLTFHIAVLGSPRRLAPPPLSGPSRCGVRIGVH